MQGSGVIAQAVDNTGRTVSLIIVGLLVVAALLAALTYWYWRYTDPRKRMRMQTLDESLDAAGGSPVPASGGHTAVAPARTADVAESTVGQARVRPTDDELLADEDGADEWLRLTGPR